MTPTEVIEPADSTQRKPKLRRIIPLIIAILALNTLGCWEVVCWLWACSYCSSWPLDQVADGTGQYAVSGGGVHVWHEVGVTGVFTPTGSTGPAGFEVAGFDSDAVAVQDWDAMLDEVVEKGYLAIRVPHAPPTYTASMIVSPTVKFTYYSPPVTTTKTTISITIARRDEYSATVNARYPITDGQSHWEVWWTPEGAEPPIPDEPFRFDGGVSPPSVAIEYGIYLGVDGHACAGCPLEYLFYNGYVFMGPFGTTIRFHGETPGNPLVMFDACYGDSKPTIMQGITPTVPFTHEHCLMNLEATTRTYTLEWSSSENWNYTVYTQANEAGSVPVPLVGDQVTLGPYEGWPVHDDEVQTLAVLTPPITISDTMRETFFITATSTVSPEVQATTFSFALAPSYQLDEGGAPSTADLSIGKVANSPVVTAGERITYTITITNDGPTTPVTAAVVDTFSDSSAIAGVTSDGDCTWTSGSAVVACTITGIVTSTPSHLTLVVATSATYSGTLSNTAVVTPTGDVTDANTDDNSAGPVEVTVRGKELGYHIYLPVVLRNF